MKNFLLITFIFLVSIISACSTATAPDANSSSNTNSANIPPEFSNRPITPDGNSTPGIPSANSANLTNLPKGATPTPGIPDPATIGKTPVPKGATPTPGIPSPEELKRQMNRTVNANVINQIPKNQKDLEKTIDDGLKEVRKKP